MSGVRGILGNPTGDLTALTSAKTKGPTSTAAVSEGSATEKKKAADAAKGFEEIFLRQLLSAVKTGKQSGYGGMATEALASGLSRAGGIGLAEQIEKSLAAALKKHGT